MGTTAAARQCYFQPSWVILVVISCCLRCGSDSVACALSAIDVEDLAGHEGCGLEIEGAVDDVGDSADAVLGLFRF